MCNLYNATTTHEAMRQLFMPINDLTNRLTPQMDVFPDYPAPIGRKDANGDRELAIARWGMPTPPQFLKGEVDYGVTNIRNVKSPHWRAWLGPANRCVVPATSFSEYGKVPDPVTKKKPLHWFALNEDKPLFWFAGIWTAGIAFGRKRKDRCGQISSRFSLTAKRRGRNRSTNRRCRSFCVHPRKSTYG